ncbi:putative FAD-linked oxidoreductase [Corynebacterium urogenitale]|uniref:Putative FAD-linked oxidoreductase n=1 Tax=Corynebacterium urogenitale TaxID=2487892 RepID=A0A5J6Z9F2_9CORY|nr:putative FAD-linked oxidoreductase [Corynebacterium urogenitale]
MNKPPLIDSSAPGSECAAQRQALLELAEHLTGTVSVDPEVLDTHAVDMAPKAEHGDPLGLVRARTVEDVQAVMKFAAARGIPVVPQGARSGLNGGANAVEGCILLSVSSMNRIVEIDATNHTVTVEPGILNLDLKNALREHGLDYPPDPGSVAISSIGGNIATNAGGLCCVKYGVTRDYVRELKVVLPDGSLTRLGQKTAKGVAGLDLCHLFIGSEGTLGVIVEATLKVVPRPAEPATAVATFPTEQAAAKTVSSVMAAGVNPSLLEFMDSATLKLLNDFGDFGLDPASGSMLIMQSDAPTRASDVEEFAQIARAQGAVDVAFSDDPADTEALIATRRCVQPANEKYVRSHGGGQLIEDICVPRSALAEFFDGLDRVRAETGVMIAVVAHAGDGNTHPSIFYDAGDRESVAAAEEAFGRIVALGLELGGTIAGEHGIGSVKSRWLLQELDEPNQALHRSIKRAIDPQGIVNPGKMLAGMEN